MRRLMLVPSLACPASCRYCFGPSAGNGRMSEPVLEAVVTWQSALNERPANDHPALEITFHGGEPLAAGFDFFNRALPLLREGLGPDRTRFAIQSNLWLLTDRLAGLFWEYGVAIGASLDGPQAINDLQRGAGHFNKTMAGIERARRHGLEPGCICTFTRASLPAAQVIFDFFIQQELNISIHAAIPSLRATGCDIYSLDEAQYGRLLVEMFERYIPNLARLRIPTLDSLCQSVAAGRGSICTFTDCLGGYLAVGPDGAVYPCQRFAGLAEFRMANVLDRASLDSMEESPTWQAFEARQRRVQEACGDCNYFSLCRGGCPYNVLAAGKGKFNGNLKDPYCASYREIFAHITDRAMQEAFSSENLQAVIERPGGPQGLLREGRLIALMKNDPHPHETVQRARRLLAAVALARDPASQAVNKLHAAGALPNPERSLAALQALERRLAAPPETLNNLYLHVTFACNLRCSHCYAMGGERDGGAMAAGDLRRACTAAAQLGFRHAVITGGEPLVHPQAGDLLEALAGLRRKNRSFLTVLRTNLAVALDDARLNQIARSTDQVVVSLDGDEQTHDLRRGQGSYAATLANLRRLVSLRAGLGERFTDPSLAAVLPAGQVNGEAGESVRRVADELGIRRTRFRPLLPVGRAAQSDLDILPEALWSHLNGETLLAYGFSPTNSCGMGQNLYVEPDGAAYPCYAWHGEQWALGNIFAPEGLAGLVAAPRFADLRKHTVNTNRRCQRCELRALCGGACRAWNRYPGVLQNDLDAAPLDCAALHARARALLLSALQVLNIPAAAWIENGLPLPDSPPALAA